MKGYRTVVLAAFPLIWALLAIAGVDVPLEDQGAIIAGVTSVMMIVMRKITTTPLGESS